MTWHGTVGLWASVGLLVLSVTGLTWSQFDGGSITAIRAELSWTTPALAPTLPARSGARRPVSPRRHRPTTPAGGPRCRLGRRRRHQLQGPGEPWTVSQVQRSWPVMQDAMALDPTTGQILQRVNFADWPIAAKLAECGVDARMGLLFGLVNQIILAALALGLICMVIWGYRMWQQRRPTRTDVTNRYAAYPGRVSPPAKPPSSPSAQPPSSPGCAHRRLQPCGL